MAKPRIFTEEAERKRVWQRAYRQANKQTTQEKARAYRIKRREDMLKNDPQAYAKFKENENAKQRAYRHANLEASREWQRRHARLNDSKPKKLKHKYGISIERFNEMRRSQHESCVICGTHERDTLSRVLGVDHDHSTGLVRGLLCSNCNSGVGHARDDPRILMSAIHYLENNRPWRSVAKSVEA